MAQHPWLDPGPFFFPGNQTGVLLIHGFTGAPTEMRPLGEFLAQKGYTVSGPQLPGHGTSVDDLADRKWTEWLAAVEKAYIDLGERCEQRFVAGLSLGTLLTIHLAAVPPDEKPPDGIALFSPGIFFANPMIHLSFIANIIPFSIPQKSEDFDLVDPEGDKRIWCYESIPGRAAYQVYALNKRVRKLLPDVTSPALVVMSTGDTALKYESGPYVIEHIASTDKQLVTLRNSGHNILCDGERESVWQQTASFFDRLVSNQNTGSIFD
ncbi:MAG: alpha/beta fold hydrolase [Anaerolineales bacterium]|nr:alpha/beta fold hydrolase [Anaerolineales bacterium]